MPNQYFIIPDKSLTKSTVVADSTTTSTYPPMGKINSMLVPNTNNHGSLVAFAFGTIADSTEYTFLIQNSGSLYETTYIWKNSTDADTLYRGLPDYRTPTTQCVPFTPNAASVGCSSFTGTYSSKLQKEFLYCVTQVGSTANYVIKVFTRAVDDETNIQCGPHVLYTDTPFTEETLGTTIEFDTEYGTGENSCIDVCQLSNGDFRLAVLNKRDIDIYHSVDGLNFTRISEKMVERFSLTYGNLRPAKIRFASAGNYLRIIFVDTLESFSWRDPDSPNYATNIDAPDCHYLYSAVSVDGGSSWSFMDRLVTQRQKDGHHGFFMDICGADETIGSFILNYAFPVDSDDAYNRTYMASGFDSWSIMTVRFNSPNIGYGIGKVSGGSYGLGYHSIPSPVHLCNGHEYIWCFFGATGGANQLGSYPIPFANDSSDIQCNSLEKTIMLIDKRYPLAEARAISLSQDCGQAFNWVESYNSADTFSSKGQRHTGYNGCRYRVAKSGKAYKIGSGIAFAYQSADMIAAGSGSMVSDWVSTTAIALMPAYERYGNWQIRPLSEYVRDANSYTDNHMYKKWPTYNYKNIIPGVLSWYEWDMFAGMYPNPFISAAPWFIGAPPKSDIVSGGFIGKNSQGFIWSNWREGSYGTPLYNEPDNTRMAFRIAAPNIGDQLFFYAKDAAVSFYHSAASGNSFGFRGKMGPPYRCWGYRSTGATGNSPNHVNMNTTGPHGVLIQASVATDLEDTIGPGPAVMVKTWAQSDYGNVYKRSAIKFAVTFSNEAPDAGYLGKARFRIYDYGNAATTIRGNIEFDTVSETVPLLRNFYEIRISSMPLRKRDVAIGVWSVSVRRTGTNEWKDFTFTPFDASEYHTSVANDYENEEQSISWGNYFAGNNVSGTGWNSYWQYIRVMPGKPMNQPSYNGLFSDRTYPEIIQGRLLSENPVQTATDSYVSWSGYGGMQNDSFTLVPNYTYNVTNALQYPSPRTQFRSQSGSSIYDITLQAVGTTTFDSTFNQDAWAIMNTNCTFVQLYGSTDNAVYDFIDSNYTHIHVATVVSATRNSMEVEWKTGTFSTVNVIPPTPYTLNKTQNITYDMTINEASGTPAVGRWKIQKHTGNKLVLETQNSAYTTGFNSSMVGSTIYVHSPNIVLNETSVENYKYLKFRFHGTDVTAEDYFKIGTIVGGLSLNLDVPIEWGTTDDSMKENVTHFNTRSGIKWGYTEGPAARTITGKITGDTNEQERIKLRNMFNSFIDISQFPVVLVMNSNGDTVGGNIKPEDIVLGEIEGGMVLKNDGWYYDEVQESWMPIGNLSITVTEVT